MCGYVGSISNLSYSLLLITAITISGVTLTRDSYSTSELIVGLEYILYMDLIGSKPEGGRGVFAPIILM